MPMTVTGKPLKSGWDLPHKPLITHKRVYHAQAIRPRMLSALVLEVVPAMEDTSLYIHQRPAQPLVPLSVRLHVPANQSLGPIRWLCTAPVKVLFETMTALQLLKLPLNSEVLCLVVCAAFVMYNLDRLRDATGAGDLKTRSTRARFFTQHKTKLQVATGIAAALAVVSVMRLPTMPTYILLPAVALSLVYSVPFLPGSRSLKQVPGIKTPFLAAMWTLASTILPALTLSTTTSHTAAMPLPFVMAFTFLNTCCLSTMADMRDVQGDRKENTPTIPVALGFQCCQALITSVCLLNCTLCLFVERPELAVAPLLIACQCAQYQSGKVTHISETCMAAPALALAASF